MHPQERQRAASCMAVSLSPLTGVPGVSNFGGHFGAYLKYAGFDALEVTGLPADKDSFTDCLGKTDLPKVEWERATKLLEADREALKMQLYEYLQHLDAFNRARATITSFWIATMSSIERGIFSLRSSSMRMARQGSP